jgi:polysaccharide deacetylase family protein (PEP-CTERM system associated)
LQPKKSSIVQSSFSTNSTLPTRLSSSATLRDGLESQTLKSVVLSFDVEEHDRIEAAHNVPVSSELKAHYRERLTLSTRWILDQLAAADVKATFFVVGEVAKQNPALVRSISDSGHEIASHGWNHQRIHRLCPSTFRTDVATSRDALEQIAGQPVLGFRAPTFSIVRETAWALDVLAELGFAYDSSIYPVRHDRYGVPAAPRGPFCAYGQSRSILELPPATLRLFGVTIPMGGGGYFRLFPLAFTRWAIRQSHNNELLKVVSLYFHPWEFDPGQLRLPLSKINRMRTYVGIRRTRSRLVELLRRYSFARAIDVAKAIDAMTHRLPQFCISA